MSQYTCRTCNKEGKEHFYSTKKYVCKPCWNQQSYQRRKDKMKDYIISIGGKCIRCGYNKCIQALCFHHRDPSGKDPEWSKNWGMTKLKTELEKCDLLCHNCHMEVHQEQGYPQNKY